MNARVLTLAIPFALAACGAADKPDAALAGPALIARGEYLVSLAGCADCHTPMNAEGPDKSRMLQGAPLAFAPLVDIPWAPVAPPIAGIPPQYTEEEFIAFLETGNRPAGTPPLPPMPSYRMHEEDARAIGAYIKSLPRGGE